MEKVWQQLKKPVRLRGTTQVMTVIIIAVGLISSLVYIIYTSMVSASTDTKEKLTQHEESINALKQDMGIIKVQLDTVISTQKAMMVLLNK